MTGILLGTYPKPPVPVPLSETSSGAYSEMSTKLDKVSDKGLGKGPTARILEQALPNPSCRRLAARRIDSNPR